jgi:hypothetical protein
MRLLKFGLAIAARLLLLLCAGTAFATSVHLAPGLEMPLPSSLIIEVLDAQVPGKAPFLAGEIGGEPGYFIAATRIKTRDQNLALWKRLESEIRKRSINKNFVSERKGNFSTQQNDPVWFRSYQYDSANQTHRQVYFLLKHDESAYWIILTAAEGVSLDLVIPIAEALIGRTHSADK